MSDIGASFYDSSIETPDFFFNEADSKRSYLAVFLGLSGFECWFM